MAGYFLSIAVLLLLLISISKRRGKIFSFSLLFFVLQAVLCAYVIISGYSGTSFWSYFSVDGLSLAVSALVSLTGLMVVISSYFNLDKAESPRQRVYYSSLILLDLMILGVIFSDNIVMNWIFLEGTTLAVVGLSYHHRNFAAVEATWKYIFTGSVGIAVAYMGILLLGSGMQSLSYDSIRETAPDCPTAVLKISFLLIFVGYSIKMEIVPLYTSAIDVNHVSPSPAAAFISSALAGGAMVSLLRLYGALSSNSEAYPWIKHVLMLSAVLSIFFAAIYMGRTGNYKRLLSYSTVENNGIAMLGLAVGGAGVYAAVLHTLFHMIIKPLLFLQTGIIGKIYGTLSIGRHSGYMKTDPLGAVVMLLATAAIAGFPPSVLFTSEITVFATLFHEGYWWVLVIVMVMLLLTLYWLFEKMLPMIFRKSAASLPSADGTQARRGISVVLLIVLGAVFAIGLMMPEPMVSFIASIADSILH